MARSRESKRDEHYLGQIREYKKLIRSLERRVRELEKGTFNSTEPREESPKKSKPQVCSECARGTLTTTDIVGRVFVSCSICGYRKKIK